MLLIARGEGWYATLGAGLLHTCSRLSQYCLAESEVRKKAEDRPSGKLAGVSQTHVSMHLLLLIYIIRYKPAFFSI